MEFVHENLLQLTFILFFCLVMLYAVYSFNKPEYDYIGERQSDDYVKELQPALPKYMTENSCYFLSMMLYVLFSLGLYVVLGFLLDNVNVKLFGLTESPAAKYLVSGLLILGISSVDVKNNTVSGKFQWIKYFLISTLRNLMHSYANTPKKGRELFNIICDGKIDYESSIAQQYIEQMLKEHVSTETGNREDLRKEDFVIGHEETLERMWAKLSYCIHFIKVGDSQGIYKSHLNDAALGWHAIDRDYDQLLIKMTKEQLKKHSQEEQVELGVDMKKLIGRVGRLISCLLLMVCRSDEDPVKRLELVGFNTNSEQRYYINVNEILIILAAVIGSIFAMSIVTGFVTLKYFDEVENVQLHEIVSLVNIIVFVGYAIPIMIIPVMLTMTMKKILCPGGRWPLYERRWGIYFLAAFVSWLFSTILMIFISMVISAVSDGMSHMPVSKAALYAFISVVTAMFAAYRVDIRPHVFKTRYHFIGWRLMGGILQGSATAGVTWICLMIGLFEGQLVPSAPLEPLVSAKLVLWEVLAFSIGFVLFLSLFIGKHFYDKRQNRRADVTRNVDAKVDGKDEKIILNNISRGGVAFIMEKARTLKKGSYIELLYDNNRRSGVIVGEDKGIMHMAFVFD